MVAEVPLPLRFAPLPEIQYPVLLPLPPVNASATVNEAPGANVAELGVAVSVPPAV